MKVLTNYYCNDAEDPLQFVTLLSYDRDKYCTVLRENGEHDSIKTGYLRGVDGGSLRYKDLVKLPHLQGLPTRTRLQQASELRRERLRNTQWAVSTGNFSAFHLYSTKAQAVKKFLQYVTRTEPPSYVALEKIVRKGPSTGYSVEFYVEDGFWCSANANLTRQFREPLNLRLD